MTAPDRVASRPTFVRARRFAAALFLALLLPALAAAQPGRIEKFELVGSEFISLDAFLALTDLEVGDSYDEEAIRREFWKIWETGLFEDVRIESAPGAGGGHVVIFTVVEKPRVDSVSYEKVKAIGEEQLEEVLRAEDALISLNSTLDEERVARTRKIIEEVLASEGYPDARVVVVQRRVAPSRISLDFRIDPGPKIKIDEIRFSGNTVFGNRYLVKLLENTKEKGWLTAWSSKTTFYRPRFEADLEEVRKAYRAKGYLDVQIGEPIVRDARQGKSGKEEKRLIVLEVPITENRPYRLGSMTVTGAEVFSNAELRRLIPLASGEVLNDRLLRLGISRIDNRYGDEGYLYAVSTPRYDLDRESLVADVDVQVVENEQYEINRIEFDGNTRTRDEVLRREMRVQEGEIFSRRDFLLSMRKIAQLGYWELNGEPEIRPVPDSEEPKVDITVRGQEVGRNEIQFGGGFSGIDGFFATFSFQSRNFLGRGAQFQASGQIGGQTTTYSVSYVEPYVFNTRGSLGGQIFVRDRNFDGFDQTGKGASLFWAYPTSTFSSFRVTGSWENSKIKDDDPNGFDDDEFTTYSLAPSFRFDTRDNPFRPTRGRYLRGVLELGWAKDEDPSIPSFDNGRIPYVKPRLEFTQYWRTTRKHYFGIHVEGGILEPYGGDDADPVLSDGVDAPFLPVYERWFLGGENSIRGVEIRSVGPRLRQYRDITNDGIDNPLLFEDRAIGGNAYYLMNVEYTVPLSDVFELTAFVDIGNSFGVENLDVFSLLDYQSGDRIEIQDSDPFDLKGTAGIELRFHTPVLQQPLRLIYGCKVLGDFYDDQGNCDFQFSIGRTFQ